MSKRILSVVLSLALLLSAVSVTGIITYASGEPVITPVTTEKAPEGNLLAGMRPMSGYTGQNNLTSQPGNKPEYLTDGEFAAADNSTGRWCGYTSTGSKLVFNLGVTTTISSFLVGSEGGVAQYADKVKIYVSETVVDRKTELFVEDNLMMDVSGMTAQNNLLSIENTTFTGMMIGFDFEGSKANYGDLIRLGELGAYGTDNVAVTDTVVTPVSAMPSGTNLLVGVTPTKPNGGNISTTEGSSMSFLTDGQFCTTNTNSADRWISYFGNGDKQVWDLGATYDIDSFLIGSENGTNEYVKQANIYVSDDKSKLFTDDSLVLSARGYHKGIGANRDNLLTSASDKKMVGRYVGFDFSNNYVDKTNPDPAGFMQGFLRLGELGVYGEPASTVEAVTELPDKLSLLAGKTPTSGVDGEPAIGTVQNQGGIVGLTDGVLASNGGVNRVGLPSDTAVKLRFDLGTSKEIAQFLVGSEADPNYFIKTVKIYVSDDKDTLFASGNLVISASGITAQNVLLSKGGITFTGRYVGFDFSGNNHPYFLRFGELAAYATADPFTMEAMTALPTDANLLAGLNAKTAMENQTTVNRVDGNLGVSGLTDGLLAAANGVNRVGLYADTATKMYYDLGSSKKIGKFLIGSEADARFYISTVRIYVGDNESTLFSNDNLAVDAYGINAQNVLLSKEDATFKGRYVGFDFSGNDHPSFLRFGELGAYATAEENTNYTLYSSEQISSAMIAPADNVLASATSTAYRHDKSTGNMNDSRMLSKLVDGIISSENSDKLCPTTYKSEGITYYYFTYDMGEEHTFDALVYIGDGNHGANSVAVYVGNDDLATIAGGSVQPNSFYDGGIGGGFVTNNKTNSQAIRFDFDQALTGRYVTFRLAACINSNYSQVWISEFAAIGQKVVKNYTLYNGTQAPGAMISAADNVLADAASTAYRTDKSTGNSTDSKMLTKLVDGIISNVGSDKLCPSSDKDNGVIYYYFTYDMGEEYTIDALVYAGDGSTGANSVAVYVGDKDLATIAGGSVEPNAFYDGGIGGDFVTNNKTNSQAIRFDFDTPLTGRYVTFRLATCINDKYSQVWVSEFGAIGEKVNAGPVYNYTKVESMGDLPDSDSLIQGMLPTQANGNNISVHEGAKLANMTDGLIQGLNQENSFVLTDDEQYKTVTYPKDSESKYYTFVAPTSLVEAQGLDTSKTWYFKPTNVWLTTRDKEQRTVMFGGDDGTAKPVYDLGTECTVESILLASAIELKGAQTNVPYDGNYDASKHPTFNDTQLADIHTPVTPDKRLLWTAKVYVGNDKATIFDDANQVLAYDLSGNYAEAVRNLWTLAEAKQGRYVAFDFNDCIMASNNKLVRVSELAVYGERVIVPLQPGANTVGPANFPNVPANLLQGSTKLEGNLNQNTAPIDRLYDGHIGGIDVAADGETRVAFNGNSGGYITVGDKQIEKVNGQARITFQLENSATIDKILVAGSAGDGADFSADGVKYDNRNVLYYEVYVSEEYADLWKESNRVLAYDNSDDPQMALIHLLDEGVHGAFVGFKVTCGAYGIARLSELGVYGTMDPLTELSFTGFDTQTQMDALVNGQANLIKGDAIEGMPLDYLANVGSAVINNEEWLSDGYIDWEALEEGGAYKKVIYDNSSFTTAIAYDFLGEVDYNALLISAVAVEEVPYRAQRVTVYVANDRKTLFSAGNQVGVALLRGANVGAYIDLASQDVQGRYIGIAIPGDAQYKSVRIAELGIYGTYLSGPEKYPQNLLSGTLPVYHKEIAARSIDNRTAVDVNGHPGSGNTGEFTSYVRNVWRHDDLALLTDGSQSTRSSQYSSACPSTETDERGSNVLYYDSNWMVFVYKLGGGTRIDDIVFASSPERDYYISGLQYYASEKYADLFKNESLLYTTGGEYYVVDEENSTEEQIKYLPDATMDDNDEQTIEYSLTDEQKAKNYRYVAVVLTRPHSLYRPSSPSNVLVGYSLFRAAEISVYGEVLSPEAPIKYTYTVKTSVGDVSVQVSTLHFDDRDFFDNTLGGVKVTETKLPDTVVPNIDDNWLSVDNDTVFTFQLVDKSGNPIKGTSPDEADALNGRELELQFPSTADYVQTMAVLRDGELHRLYNSFTNIQKDRKINAGVLVYPTYDDGFPNNRDKAVLSGTEVSLVYMKANGYNQVNKLSNRKVNDSLADFIAGGGVAGANADDTLTPWYILPILAVAIATVTTTVILMRRKARRDGQ